MNNQKEVYIVYTNTDLTEGRGERKILAICESFTTAIRLGKREYVQGGDCPISKEILEWKGSDWYGPVNIIKPSAADILVEKNRKIRESAEQKLKNAGLTEEEIKVLKNIL